jgi:hypothetical protein
MKCFHLALILFVAAMTVPAEVYAQPSNFNTSLHSSRAGKDYWYGAANGGFESFTGIPIEDLGCTGCHGPTDADGNPYPDPYPGADCSDCHPASFFPVSETQCYGCHGRQQTEAVTLGYSDVHRDAGMVCWDCHSTGDIHGDGTVYSSMLEPGAIDADCSQSGCHTSLPPEHAGNDPHEGKLHCKACHTQSVVSCYNCHFESLVDSGVKRAKQPISNFVMLVNRTKDNKVHPATFQSLTYQGDSFVAFAPYTAHTITRDGARGCPECHVNAPINGSNPTIEEYNATGEIKFVTWDDLSGQLTWLQGVVPIPADYETTLKMDFITYDGATSDPPGPSTNWSPIGTDVWNGHQMFFATPLTRDQMRSMGFATTVDAPPARNPERRAQLERAEPNPFNPMTEIHFRLDDFGDAQLFVYDVRGRLVRTFDLPNQSPGPGSTTWDGTDSSGRPVASGSYMVLLSSLGETDQIGVTLIK